MIQIRMISMSFCKELNDPPPSPPSSPLLNIMKALSTQIEQFQKYQVSHFSFGSQLIQGYPHRIRLQRRQYGIISVFFLIFRVDFFLYLQNQKVHQLKQRYILQDYGDARQTEQTQSRSFNQKTYIQNVELNKKKKTKKKIREFFLNGSKVEAC